jgi:hypothetical protein
VQRLLLAFRTAEATAVDLPGDGTFGLDVDVTRLPAIALDAATLAALENITVTVANPGSGQATETTLAAVLAAVDGLEGGIAPLATQVTLAAVAASVARGTFGYAAGTVAATVDVPSGARVRYVTVLSGAGPATVTIAGGAAITVPTGGNFDRALAGDAPLGADVVIGGTVASYYVEWSA